MAHTTQGEASISRDQLDAFARDGFHIARGVLGRDEVDAIRDAFMDQAKNGPVEGLSEFRHHVGGEYNQSDPLRFYPRMLRPHIHLDKPVGALARRYMLDPRIGAILRQLLAEEPLAANTMFYFKPPGARGQDLHQDNFYLRVRPGTCIAAWIAIDDADEGNGGMVCVPETGKLELACPERSDPALFFTTEHVEPPAGTKPQLIPLKAGDILFFNGSVIHGSYPNTSKDRFRRSLICHYVPMSCVETATHYRPLLRFDGIDVTRQDATGGGPCGTMQATAAPH